MSTAIQSSSDTHQIVRLFLCGDVMIGRGIDQIMPHPCGPRLYEEWVQSASDYVRLAERMNGPIPTHVEPSYIWGAALDELRRVRPDARIINLETSITRNEGCIPKGINYRMSPENAECLLAADIDCCVLGNNHVLDWERLGLLETLATLKRLGIKTAGAGRDLAQASAPAVLQIEGKGRVIVYSFAMITSGVPRDWAATPEIAGVNLLPDFASKTIISIADQVARIRQPRDLVIASIHWGPNWGYEIAEEQRRFAHALIDRANVSVVHGHSSHHAKAIEIYKNRVILYGCGDFLNDYEGISGYEEFRGDLSLMYLPRLSAARGKLIELRLLPFRITRFRLQHASAADAAWLQQRLDAVCQPLGIATSPGRDGTFSVCWR